MSRAKRAAPIGDNRSCATGADELGDCGQEMCQEGQQVLHGGKG